MGDDSNWEAVLGELAGHLAAQRRSLAAGHPEQITAYVPPPDLGPVPEQLRPRFDTLRAESLAMEAEVTRSRDELGRRLAALPRRRGPDAGSGPSHYFDVSA